MLTGVTLGHGVARSPVGLIVPFSLIKPTKTIPNLVTLAAENKRWRDTVKGFKGKSRAVLTRAKFADDVLAAAIENVRLGAGDVIVAQAAGGAQEILGIATYIVEPSRREGYIGLVATAPEFVPGAQDPAKQIRGIGTSIVAAVSRDMLGRGVDSVFLHPKDVAASRFWAGRGFQVCGLGNLLCVRGRAAIDRLRGTCEVTPECPDQGDCLSCGGQRQVAHVTSSSSP